MAAAIGVMSVAFGGYAFYLRSRVRATLRWKPTQATISSSQTEERTVYRGQRRHALAQGTPVTQYRPDIRYVYAAGTIEHEGRRVFFGQPSWSSRDGEARTMVAQYPQGAVVKAYYDPARPQDSVLQRGQHRGSSGFTWVAIFMAVIAVVVYAVRGWL